MDAADSGGLLDWRNHLGQPAWFCKACHQRLCRPVQYLAGGLRLHSAHAAALGPILPVLVPLLQPAHTRTNTRARTCAQACTNGGHTHTHTHAHARAHAHTRKHTPLPAGLPLPNGDTSTNTAGFMETQPHLCPFICSPLTGTAGHKLYQVVVDGSTVMWNDKPRLFFRGKGFVARALEAAWKLFPEAGDVQVKSALCVRLEDAREYWLCSEVSPMLQIWLGSLQASHWSMAQRGGGSRHLASQAPGAKRCTPIFLFWPSQLFVLLSHACPACADPATV